MLSSSTTQTGSGWLSVMQRKISAFSRCAIWARFISVMSVLTRAMPPSGRGWLVSSFQSSVDGLRLDRQHVALLPPSRRVPNELVRRLDGQAVEAFEIGEDFADGGDEVHFREVGAGGRVAPEYLGIGVDKNLAVVEQRIACTLPHRRAAGLHVASPQVPAVLFQAPKVGTCLSTTAA